MMSFIACRLLASLGRWMLAGYSWLCGQPIERGPCTAAADKLLLDMARKSLHAELRWLLLTKELVACTEGLSRQIQGCVGRFQ